MFGGNAMSGISQRGLLGVVADPKSYINILYLLLAFPLGIAYFVFLVVGTSLGLGLTIVWVGVPILALVLAGSWVLCGLERVLAISLLKEDIRPSSPLGPSNQVGAHVQGVSSGERLFIGMWRRFKAHVSNRLIWTGMLYLLLKFPLGIASFIIVVTLVAVTGALLAAPFYYSSVVINWGAWNVDTLWETSVLALIGIPMVLISLHLMNGMAFLSGRAARVMLGKLG